MVLLRLGGVELGILWISGLFHCIYTYTCGGFWCIAERDIGYGGYGISP